MEWINADFLLLQMQLDGAQAHRRYAPCGNADGAGWWSPPNKLSFSRENVVTGARLLRSPVSPALS